jgi:phytoene dehydrogenase-like protein
MEDRGGKTMSKSIIIIGAGMGGLAAGVYGQLNGYETRIFEMDLKPGGQCASWTRKGHTFDACIHHFFGCKDGTEVNRMWTELGALPREVVDLDACTAVASPDGTLFVDYYDIEKLRETLLRLSPADKKMIERYIRAIEAFADDKVEDAINSGSVWKMLLVFLTRPAILKWIRMDMNRFALQFSDPFLKKAFAQLIYSNPEAPLFFHLMRHAGGLNGDIRWPAGGAGSFARSIAERYLALGGEIRYRIRVEKILVEDDKAVGVRLADGSEHRADIVISNADGRKTILEMLDGRYVNESVLGYCRPLQDDTPFALNVCLGVDRDLSGEPSSLVLLLDEPVTIGGHTHDSIEVQTYGFDTTMAPEGKGTIKVELTDSYAYWKKLHTGDRNGYRREKQKAAEQVIDILDGHFHGIKHQVEVVDVYTLMTWERYMGGSQGWFILPNRKIDFSMKAELSDKKFKMELPGLSNFYLAGTWTTAMGSLAHNARSGQTVIRRICHRDGRQFRTQP